jgi:aspartate racemase
MAYIWGDILSINPPELDDDFFALGGDSLHAASLFVEIEKRFNLKLPLAVLLENNTVRKLSACLKSDSLAPKKSLVAIRSQGTRKPLFMLPGGSGDVLYLRNLANYVDADRPLYGLQAFLPDSDPYHASNMERTASAYLTEIMELQPQGPYFLAGHSFGGYVAMEMARLLIKHGREVAFLGLWDTYPPGPRRQASLPDRIMIHLENLRGLRPGQMLGYFRDHWHTLLIRSTHLAAVRTYLRWIKYTPKTTMEVARLSRYGFLPEPYPGSLFLFRVSQRPWYVRWDPMENWRKYVLGDMEIREVQGKHGNMLFEPYVQNLSQELNDCLRQVEARLLSEHRDQE